jgi:hypothetical protein
VEIDPGKNGTALSMNVMTLRARKLGVWFVGALVAACQERALRHPERIASYQQIDIVSLSKVWLGVHGISEPSALEEQHVDVVRVEGGDEPAQLAVPDHFNHRGFPQPFYDLLMRSFGNALRGPR